MYTASTIASYRMQQASVLHRCTGQAAGTSVSIVPYRYT
jgi:hypothetical protein